MKPTNNRLTKTEFEQALTSPVSIFSKPIDVVQSVDLSISEKIEILKRWELDARSLQRASDESMGGGEPPLLDEVNQALKIVDPENSTTDGFGNAPTKI